MRTKHKSFQDKYYMSDKTYNTYLDMIRWGNKQLCWVIVEYSTGFGFCILPNKNITNLAYRNVYKPLQTFNLVSMALEERNIIYSLEPVGTRTILQISNGDIVDCKLLHHPVLLRSTLSPTIDNIFRQTFDGITVLQGLNTIETKLNVKNLSYEVDFKYSLPRLIYFDYTQYKNLAKLSTESFNIFCDYIRVNKLKRGIHHKYSITDNDCFVLYNKVKGLQSLSTVELYTALAEHFVMSNNIVEEKYLTLHNLLNEQQEFVFFEI